MLRFVILSLIFSIKLEASSCFLCSGNQDLRPSYKAEHLLQDTDFQSFIKESLKKSESLLSDPTFQDVITELNSKISPQTSDKITTGEPSSKVLKSLLYIFVSFSLGEKALLNLAYDAKRYGATLVLRGFVEGSYRKTVQALHKIIIKTGQGALIDPELFSLFSITTIPTYVLTRPFQLYVQERTQTPLHDRLQGHVSLQYALEMFAKEGDLQNEAQFLLKKRETK